MQYFCNLGSQQDSNLPSCEPSCNICSFFYIFEEFRGIVLEEIGAKDRCMPKVCNTQNLGILNILEVD